MKRTCVKPQNLTGLCVVRTATRHWRGGLKAIVPMGLKKDAIPTNLRCGLARRRGRLHHGSVTACFQPFHLIGGDRVFFSVDVTLHQRGGFGMSKMPQAVQRT